MADRLYRRGGPEALSVRAVAAEIGVTPMALYKHYPNKAALVDALVAAGFEKWEAVLAQAVRRRGAVARIRHTLLAYAEFALAERRLFELMFLTARPRIPRAPASLESTPSPSFNVVIKAVKHAMDTGEIPQGNPSQTLLLAWSTAHGAIALHFSGRFGHDDKLFRKTYRGLVDQLVALWRRS